MNRQVAHRLRLPPALLMPILPTLLLAGCGGGGGGSSSTSGSGMPVGPGVAGISAVTPSGLTAILSDGYASTIPIAVGGSVTYTLTLFNGTGQPITVTPVPPAVGGTDLTNIGASLTVKSPSGATVYPPGAGTTSGAAGPSVTVAAGQSVVDLVTVSNVFTTSGTYAATATFTLTGGSPATTQTTTVGPLNVTVQ